MATPVCSQSGCITKKYGYCTGINSASGGPCATDFSIDWNTGLARVLAWGDSVGVNNPVAINPSVGLSACDSGAFPSGSRLIASTSFPGVGVPVSEVLQTAGSPAIATCDGEVGLCPACIFVQMGVNLCNPCVPTIVPSTVEEASNGGSPALRCNKIWIIHLACGFKGKFCVSYCCDDPSGN